MIPSGVWLRENEFIPIFIWFGDTKSRISTGPLSQYFFYFFPLSHLVISHSYTCRSSSPKRLHAHMLGLELAQRPHVTRPGADLAYMQLAAEHACTQQGKGRSCLQRADGGACPTAARDGSSGGARPHGRTRRARGVELTHTGQP